MPETSQDFVDALRNGHYAKALALPVYITHKYKDEKLDADTILPTLIYEILCSDFSTQDIPHLQIFYAFMDDYFSSLAGEHQYAITILYSALLMALIEREKGLIVDPKIKLSVHQIEQLLAQNASEDDEASRLKYQELIVPNPHDEIDKQYTSMHSKRYSRLYFLYQTTKNARAKSLYEPLKQLQSRILNYFHSLQQTVRAQPESTKAVKSFFRHWFFASSDIGMPYREARLIQLSSLGKYLEEAVVRIDFTVLTECRHLLSDIRRYSPSTTEAVQLDQIESHLAEIESDLYILHQLVETDEFAGPSGEGSGPSGPV